MLCGKSTDSNQAANCFLNLFIKSNRSKLERTIRFTTNREYQHEIRETLV